MTYSTVASELITVIMPCYNREQFVTLSVRCVLEQSHANLELIVIDDGSTDGSLQVLQGIEDRRLKVISQPNRGVSAARNRGIEVATGAYIAFLDSDDTWEPDFLESMLDALNSQPGAVLAYCGWQNVGLPGGAGKPFVPPEYEGPGKVQALFADTRWPIHATLTHTKAIRAAGAFNPIYRNSEDFALWLRVAVSGVIVRVPRVLAYYHFHDAGQATANLLNASLQHWQAQYDFLADYPDIARHLGQHAIRQLTYGKLLKEGMAAHWRRDLPMARILFRKVMRHGYGSWRNWAYMLPAWLPLPLHRTVIQLFELMK